MNSFMHETVTLPLGVVWLMNALAEYKGKQDLYTHQSPQVLSSLVEMALIESAESSNRIEGVLVDHDRLKPLILGRSKPRDRSEEEVAGYRKALELIHAKHQSLRIDPKTILELHRLCRGEFWDAGKWKEKDNEIIRKHPNGRVEVVFQPATAKETPEMILQLCLTYEHSVTQIKTPDLYAVACLILDFLSIHPFRDGNGRVSRLLTLLALYQHGYQVGKYISLERIVEQSKKTYYESLNKSSQGWHHAKHDVFPWCRYFFRVLLEAYQEFETRAVNIKTARGAKTAMITQAIEQQVAHFTLNDIERACPSVSREMIKLVFRSLQKSKKIQCLNKGKSATWQWI